MSFEVSVQKAIFAALTGSVAANVYDAVPQKAAFPYVTIGDDNFVEWDTVTTAGMDVSVTIHAWTQGKGRIQNKTLQGQIYNALHNATLTAAGYHVISCQFESANSFMDSDDLTRHGVQVFRVLIDRV
jgi:hypothetical protein